MESQENSKHPFLKAKYRVGSCKGAMDFGRDEAVFPPLSKELLERNREVKQFKRTTKYSTGQVPWDDGVVLDDISNERKSAEIHFFDHSKKAFVGGFDYRSTVLPDSSHGSSFFNNPSYTMKRRKFDPVISRGGKRRMTASGGIGQLSTGFNSTGSLFDETKSSLDKFFTQEDEAERAYMDDRIGRLYTKGPFRPFSQRRHVYQSSQQTPSSKMKARNEDTVEPFLWNNSMLFDRKLASSKYEEEMMKMRESSIQSRRGRRGRRGDKKRS